uniref:Uncharacterized protein n=1 Tax=viral metagenome TaxID=1070528 RepID=A0A6M3X8V6_9ZZZZ
MRKMRLCSIEGCKKKHDSNGLCKTHYMRKYRKSRKEARQRLFETGTLEYR